MRTLELENGDSIPALGLGTWKSGKGEVHEAVVEAIQLGYRHIDCAPIYDNEAEIGDALAKCIRDGLIARGDMWITSKLWCDAHAPEDVEPALLESLAALQLEHLNLYLMHWPVALKKGVGVPQSGADMIALDDLPAATTWAAMERLVDRGLCRHIGVSNFSLKKLSALNEQARIKPAVNQVEMHPYLQQNALYDYCNANGIVMTAYSPFGSRDRSPLLKQPDEPDLFEDPVIRAIADERGATAAQIILGWLLGRHVATLPKSVNRERIAQNLAAQSIELRDDEMQRIARITRRYRFVSGRFWELAGGPYTVAELWDEPANSPLT